MQQYSEAPVTISVMMDNVCGDPLQHAMQTLKAAMLEKYAVEEKLEMVIEYSHHFTYATVTGEARLVNHLLFTLNRKGCVDIHVYCEDKDEIKYMKNEHGNLFRFCNVKWSPK